MVKTYTKCDSVKKSVVPRLERIAEYMGGIPHRMDMKCGKNMWTGGRLRFDSPTYLWDWPVRKMHNLRLT